MLYTGAAGTVQVDMGNDRNYWFYVRSSIAGGTEYPSDGDPTKITVEQFATTAETTAGAVIQHDVTLDVLVDLPDMSDLSPSGEAVASIDAQTATSWVVAEGYYTYGKFIKQDESSSLHYYLLDQSGYDAFVAGNAFTALAAAQDAQQLSDAAVAVPATGALWLVAHNAAVSKTAQVALELTVSAQAGDN